MKEKSIMLDNGLQIVVYSLDPNLKAIAQPKTGIEDVKKSELDKYAKIYYNEDLIKINSAPYPFVFLTSTTLDNVSMSIKQKPFNIPKKFEKFSKKILEERLKPGAFNGQMVRLSDLKVDGGIVSLTCQKAGYFEFIATNLSQDIKLAKYDASFDSEKTLRDYEIKYGKSVDLKKSNMANILGVGFIVLARDYFIFARRNANMVGEPSTLGMLGGTPNWEPEFHENLKVNFEEYLKDHTREEMEEELLLGPNEYNITKCFFLKDFTRAPDVMLVIDVNVSPEDIAKRCYGKKSVLAEHDTLCIVPKDHCAIESLIHSDLMLNIPSRIAMDLIFKN